MAFLEFTNEQYRFKNTSIFVRRSSFLRFKNSQEPKYRVRRIQVYTREAKRCYRECTTPPGFVEVARSRNLELIRRRYIIHDTIGRSAGPGRTPRLRLAFYIMRASIFFSEVSGRQPSGRLFFARTSCLDAREARSASPFLSSYHFEDRILDKSIHVPCHSEEREKKRKKDKEKGRERERERVGEGRRRRRT